MAGQGGAGRAWPVLLRPSRWQVGRWRTTPSPISEGLNRGSKEDEAAPWDGNSPSLRQGRVSTLKLLRPPPCCRHSGASKAAAATVAIATGRRAGRVGGGGGGRLSHCRRRSGSVGGGGGGKDGSFLRGRLRHQGCDCAQRRRYRRSHRSKARTTALGASLPLSLVSPAFRLTRSPGSSFPCFSSSLVLSLSTNRNALDPRTAPPTTAWLHPSPFGAEAMTAQGKG